MKWLIVIIIASISAYAGFAFAPKGMAGFPSSTLSFAMAFFMAWFVYKLVTELRKPRQ